MAIPTIDMVRTGQNINRLRKNAGVSVKDLQDVFGFATPQTLQELTHIKVGSFFYNYWRVNDTSIGIIGYKGSKHVLMDIRLMYN